MALDVVSYCVCGGPRGQLQIKVKPLATNNGTESLPLAADNFRLIVPSPLLGPWTPPSGTAPAEDLDVDGVNRQAVPPNPDGAAEPMASGRTFATHWTDRTLDPGTTYVDDAVKQGDLVFYLPTDAAGSASILGLAYITTTQGGESVIQGFASIDEWRGLGDPNAF